MIEVFIGRHFHVCFNYILLVYLEMGGLLFDYWYDDKSQLFFRRSYTLQNCTHIYFPLHINKKFPTSVSYALKVCVSLIQLNLFFPTNTIHPTAAKIK